MLKTTATDRPGVRAPEYRCSRCSRILIRGYSKDECPECLPAEERDDEEEALRARLYDPHRWDAILAQDRRTLEFCRNRLREVRRSAPGGSVRANEALSR